MAAGKRASNAPGHELPVSGVESDDDGTEEFVEDPSVSVEEVSILAYRDMLQAMAYPFGILTMKQMKLAKTFGKLLRIPEGRQKMEMRAVYTSLESKRLFRAASEEAAAMDTPAAIPASALPGPPSAPLSPSDLATSSDLPERSAAPLRNDDHLQHHQDGNKVKKRHKKTKMKKLLNQIKAAAATTTSAIPDPEQSSSPSSLPSVHSTSLLLNLADVSVPVVPPLCRAMPVTPISAAVNSVVERYRGEVKALWKNRNRHYVRKPEIST